MSTQAREREIIDLPEHLLVKRLLQKVGTLYEFFNFVVEPALGPPPRVGWDYLFLAGAQREFFGFRNKKLPGDVDILIVPTFNDHPDVSRCCAVEVKRLALRGPKWDKNVDRYGISQAHGLLDDGFPFVGVLHIVVSNPGPIENHKELEEWRVVGDYGEVERVGPKVVDLTSYYAAERQLSRLAMREPRKEVGLNCVAISLSEKNVDRAGISCGPSGVRYASRNPKTSQRLLNNIEKIVEAGKDWFLPREADIGR